MGRNGNQNGLILKWKMILSLILLSRESIGNVGSLVNGQMICLIFLTDLNNKENLIKN